MNSNKEQMLGFLEAAKKVMKKSDELRPIKINNSYVDNNYNPINEEQSYQQQYYSQASNGNSYIDSSNKLPKSILESIKSNPIQEFNSTNGLSVLDSILPSNLPNTSSQQSNTYVDNDYMQEEKEIPTTEELIARSRYLNEKKQNYKQQLYQQPSQQSINIDYSLIRMMIEECISKEIRSLKKSLITEGKSGVSSGEVILMAGDTIKFINKKGDVYEGIVKKTKHIDI